MGTGGPPPRWRRIGLAALLGTAVLAAILWNLRGAIEGTVSPGAPLADLELRRWDGQSYNLRDLIGLPTILRISSPTCSFCAEDYPSLQRLQQLFGPRIRVVAVELARREEIAFRRPDSWDFLILLDPGGQLAHLYAIHILPSYVFLGADGRLVGIQAGDPTPEEWATWARRIAPAS